MPHSSVKRTAIIILLLLVFSCTPPPKPPLVYNNSAPYQDLSSEINFPAALGALQKKQLIVYPGKEQGLTLTYAGNAGQSGTIYLYNEAPNDIDPAVGFKILDDQKKSAINDVFAMEKTGQYSNIKQSQDLSITFKEKTTEREKQLDGYLITFSYTENNIPVISALVLAIYNRHTLKIRYTYPAELGAAGRAEFEKFITDLGTLLTPNWGYRIDIKQQR